MSEQGAACSFNGYNRAMPPTSEPGSSVSSRLLQVLFAFRPGHTRLTLAELARRTGMAQATVHRLALELGEAGALERGAWTNAHRGNAIVAAGHAGVADRTAAD